MFLPSVSAVSVTTLLIFAGTLIPLIQALTCDPYCAVGCTNKGEGKCDGNCTIVSYRGPVDGVCQPCADNCEKECNFRGGGRCDKCKKGYGLTSNFTCDTCAANCGPTGCSQNGAGTCDECAVGGLTSDFKCASCPEFCDSCKVATFCVKCSPSYGLTGTKQCEKCDPYCGGGCETSGAGKCDATCINKYALDTLNNCKPCDNQCIGGCTTAGPGKCDQAPANSPSCVTGYTLTANKTCARCDTNCSGTCEINGPGKCDKTCVLSFALDPVTNTCVPLVCDPNCNSGCNATGMKKCDGSCVTGYQRNSNNTCEVVTTVAPTTTATTTVAPTTATTTKSVDTTAIQSTTQPVTKPSGTPIGIIVTGNDQTTIPGTTGTGTGTGTGTTSNGGQTSGGQTNGGLISSTTGIWTVSKGVDLTATTVSYGNSTTSSDNTKALVGGILGAVLGLLAFLTLGACFYFCLPRCFAPATIVGKGIPGPVELVPRRRLYWKWVTRPVRYIQRQYPTYQRNGYEEDYQLPRPLTYY